MRESRLEGSVFTREWNVVDSASGGKGDINIGELEG